ncbi:MAG TPA: hypothetical protein VFK44_05735 [Bacillales bacterium]|nr:hypothetical protein [Bacillales bacterium]
MNNDIYKLNQLRDQVGHIADNTSRGFTHIDVDLQQLIHTLTITNLLLGAIVVIGIIHLILKWRDKQS